jgi:hypothetical protein
MVCSSLVFDLADVRKSASLGVNAVLAACPL